MRKLLADLKRLWQTDRAKLAKRAALAGAVLALACPLLPHGWRAACHALVTLLTGGSL